jgi:hypothetical protein
MDTNYSKCRAIDVTSKIEKKNGLSYLSWAWAVDQLLLQDSTATWVYGEPVRFGDTLMVFCTVTAFGKAMTAQLPVMDHRNKAIPNPDAFAVNTAMQRCLVKAIALHGIGLYIYAGEDLPDSNAVKPEGDLAAKFKAALDKDYDGKTEEEAEENRAKGIFAVHESVKDGELYRAAWKLLDPPTRSALKYYIDMAKGKKAA